MLFRWLHNRRRKIFRFHDGRRVRSIDPIEAAIGLSEHKTYLPELLDEARFGNSEALAQVATAACDVFGVAPLAADGKSGLTVAERLELLLAFDLYLHALKKNTARWLTPPVSTASTSAVSSEPTTSDTSDSGATAPAPPFDPLNGSGSASSPPPTSPSSAGI